MVQQDQIWDQQDQIWKIWPVSEDRAEPEVAETEVAKAEVVIALRKISLSE